MHSRLGCAFWKEGVITIIILHILLAIAVFGLLIFIHEFGHYLCARLCGVGIHEFSIGMGPAIFGWTSKKTGIRYGLRLLPVGGYVSMVGEDEESDREDAFGNKSVWKRILIVTAGPIMNLLLGFFAMLILVVSTAPLGGTTIVYPDDGTVHVSDAAGLDSEDVILKVENVRVHTANELTYEVIHQGDKPLDFTILRNGEKMVIEDVVFSSQEELGVTFGTCDFGVRAEKFTFLNVIKHTFFRSISTVKMIIDSFVDLLTGRYGVESVSGPVGITQAIGESTQYGFSSFLYLFVVITVNLGVFNLLPFPALDGGSIIFALYELITRRKVKSEIVGYASIIGFALLMILAVFVTAGDIAQLFK